MKKILNILAAGVSLLTIGASSASAVLYTAGGTLTVRDKLFTFNDCFVSSSGTATAGGVDCAHINITGLVDPVYGVGIRLNSPIFATAPGDFYDISFDYSVAVTDGIYHITDAHLGVIGAGSFFFADEAALGGVTSLHVDQDTPGLVDDDLCLGSATSTGCQVYTSLRILKDYGVVYTDGPSRLTSVTQIFSQDQRFEVPEPGTLLLFGSALAGLASLRRRQKKA